MHRGPINLQALLEQAQRLDELEEAVARAARQAPADVAAILEFFEIPSGNAFDVKPEQAIAFFKAKGLSPTFSYADMLGEAHDHAFTIAKMMDVDMLGQMRASLDSAFANGTPFNEWADSITPMLQSGGWWGRKKVLDPITKRTIVAQLGSPWRLETIFRTNMQTAYAAGAWQEITEQADLAPFLMYDAVDDLRTRPLHAGWDRTVLPVTSSWWKTHYPPNGYNCRCGVIQLDADQVESLGLTVAQKPPFDGNYLWTNPRTGYASVVPKGLDPGFDNNSGMSFAADAKKLLDEKIAALTASQEAAAKRALAQSKKFIDQANDAAAQAQKDMAAAASKAALARSQALAAEKSKQWAAQQQVDAIAKSKDTSGPGALKIKALQQLKAGDTWPELKPAEQLQQIDDLAADLKKKVELSKNLSLYKKQILDGKNPSPATAKAFASLSQAEQDAFLAKIEAEKVAKKAAEDAAAAKAAEEAAKAAAEAQPAAAVAKPLPKLTGGEPPDPASLTKIGEQKGSNPGGTYQDTSTGTKWYIKQPASADVARNEVLAGKLYELAGVEVPEMHIVQLNGKTSIASKIVDGLTKGGPADLASAAGAAEGFAVDAWLGNWDVVGMGYDNLLLKAGRAFRVDTGGALRYRAQGGLKGAAWNDLVPELESLRDPSLNRQAHGVFGSLSDAQIEAAAVRVLKISDGDIRSIVEQFGPEDLAERGALADRLIARKATIAKRYPGAAERARRELGAAEEPPKAAPRVTAAEQAEVEASRVNGYGFATDSDQIEDNMVVVHAFKRADGSDATRGFFKLRPEASADLARVVKAGAGVSPTVDLAATRQSILDAIKSINFRADKGQALDVKVVQRIETMQAAVAAMRKEIDAAIAKAIDPTVLTEKRNTLTAWARRVEDFLDDARAGKPAQKIPGAFPVSAFPDSLGYSVKDAGPVPAGLQWKKVAGRYEFETASFDRSFATENGGKATVYGADLRYEAELADGTRVVYFPHDPGVAWAMQGVVKIDTAGKSAGATARVFGAMDEAGIKSVRAGEVDRQHLYLNAFARIRLIRTSALAEFEAVADKGAEGVAKKLAILKKATGVDVAASDGWKTIDGVRQAFGHGRAHQLRPDLETPEFRKFEREFYLFHNPQGLGSDSGSGVFERLKVVIDGGGMFAPLTDRVRRGVPLAGSSVSSDLASGGADYHFTRIARRGGSYGSGVYWRASRLKRMDAITYTSDQFGRTTAGHVEANRKGQTVADFVGASNSSGNETIFKGGLSIFDDVDRIVLSSEAEVKSAIAWMQGKGYKTWPDGRSLAEVIISKAKHAKP